MFVALSVIRFKTQSLLFCCTFVPPPLRPAAGAGPGDDGGGAQYQRANLEVYRAPGSDANAMGAGFFGTAHVGRDQEDAVEDLGELVVQFLQMAAPLL